MSTVPESAASGHVKTFPLNSRRLTAETVTRIARALGLPTNASQSEVRQLIEGKLAEDYEPKNVQVDVTALQHGITTIELRDESGVLLEIPAEDGTEEGRKSDGEKSRSRSASVGPGTGDGEEAGGARVVSASREEELEGELESARDRIHELELELERACERAEEGKTRLAE